MEEHGLLVADRHLAQRCRLRDPVVCVPTLRSLPDRGMHLVLEKEEVAVGPPPLGIVEPLSWVLRPSFGCCAISAFIVV